MMTMSACLPGVSEPVRSAIPATSAPPMVAQPRTWRDVMRPGDGRQPVEVRVPRLLVLAAALRAEDRVHLGELVGGRRRGDVRRQADRDVVLEGGHGRRPAVTHLDLDLRRERDVAARVAGERPLLRREVRGVDVGRVRVQQVHVPQARDLHLRVAESVHRDVDRDVDVELLGQLPVVADDLGLAEVGAAGRERHRDPPVVRVEVLAAEASRIGAVGGQHAAGVVRPEPPVDERGVREAVGEDGPDPRLLQPADGLVGVVRRVHDVRPVDERRDARVDALERAPQVGGVDVVRPIVRRELVEDGPEVGDQREVGRAGPDRRLPGVAVGVDEARDDDVAGRIDRPRAVGRQVLADGDDPVSSTRTSAPAISPSAGSWVSTIPPLMSNRSVIDRPSFGVVGWVVGCVSVRRRSLGLGSSSWPIGHRRPSSRRWLATIEKSASSPSDRSAARISLEVDGRLRHRRAGRVGEGRRSGAGPSRPAPARTRRASRPAPRTPPACSRRTGRRRHSRPGRRRRAARSMPLRSARTSPRRRRR